MIVRRREMMRVRVVVVKIRQRVIRERVIVRRRVRIMVKWMV